MKRILLVGAMLTGPLVGLGDEHFATLKAGSEVYSNVTVTSATATQIYFTHSGGIAGAKLKDLELDMQKRYHYDAATAAAAELKQQQDNAAYRQVVISQAATNKPASTSVGSSGTYASQAGASSGTETQVQTRSSGSRTIVVRPNSSSRPPALPRNNTIPERSAVHSSTANPIQKPSAVLPTRSAPSKPAVGATHP